MPFQSTHPLRSATATSQTRVRSFSEFQSTHPLRGATWHQCAPAMGAFQSTHPLRDAIFFITFSVVNISISIHAPLAGYDSGAVDGGRQDQNFNPRTPCRMRQRQGAIKKILPYFNPRTPSGVQPHVLQFYRVLHFNPRTPYGMRLRGTLPPEELIIISIHAPLTGCDNRAGCRYGYVCSPFQSTHPLRGATVVISTKNKSHWSFQSTHPLRGATVYSMVIYHSFSVISIHAPLTGCDIRLF